MDQVNTIYSECALPIWDSYFKLPDLKYKPKVLIGAAHQKKLIEAQEIEFIDRIDFTNINLEIEYELNEHEILLLKKLQDNQILYKMFARFSYDKLVDKKCCNNLIQTYLKYWLTLIKKYSAKALVLFEMPHVPYSYIGYLIFKSLGFVTLFSSTFPVKNKSFWVSSIENYSIFEDQKEKIEFRSNQPNNTDEEFLNKIILNYGIPVSSRAKTPSFVFYALLNLRNFLFPGQSSQRLYYKAIIDNKFINIGERNFYYRKQIDLCKKLVSKLYYRFISKNNLINNGGKKVFYALHFEPEMAVLPMGGDFYDQFEVLKNLSNELKKNDILYIKEHPWTFDYNRIPGIIRELSFYNSLKKKGNVVFLDDRVNTSEIISSVDLVVTLSGTVGWEAFLKKIPVLYYGHAWYGGLPNVYKYNNESIYRILDALRSDLPKINYSKIFDVLSEKVHNVSVKMMLDSKMEYDEKSVELKTLIEKVI